MRREELRIEKHNDIFKIVSGLCFVFAVDFLGLSLSNCKRDKTCGIYFVYGEVAKKEYIKVPNELLGDGRKFKIYKRVMDEIVEDEIEINIPFGISLANIPDYLKNHIAESERRRKIERDEETLKELIGLIEKYPHYSAIQIREFNKTLAGKFLLEKGEFKHNGKRIIILHNYLTHRLNNTVILAIIDEKDNYPSIKANNLAHFIIGKKGRNIKDVCEKYNLRKIFLTS